MKTVGSVISIETMSQLSVGGLGPSNVPPFTSINPQKFSMVPLFSNEPVAKISIVPSGCNSILSLLERVPDPEIEIAPSVSRTPF